MNLTNFADDNFLIMKKKKILLFFLTQRNKCIDSLIRVMEKKLVGRHDQVAKRLLFLVVNEAKIFAPLSERYKIIITVNPTIITSTSANVQKQYHNSMPDYSPKSLHATDLGSTLHKMMKKKTFILLFVVFNICQTLKDWTPSTFDRS
jgi:hypothetical protein